jgi:ABC-type branched-subunit amino acid transport system permease subunit
VTDSALPAPRDPGLQPERTALSWTRTALVVAVNALLALRTGLVQGEPWLVVVGAVLFATAGAVAAAGVLRRRELDAGSFAPAPWLMGAVAVATVASAAVGVATVVVGTP